MLAGCTIAAAQSSCSDAVMQLYGSAVCSALLGSAASPRPKRAMSRGVTACLHDAPAQSSSARMLAASSNAVEGGEHPTATSTCGDLQGAGATGRKEPQGGATFYSGATCGADATKQPYSTLHTSPTTSPRPPLVQPERVSPKQIQAPETAGLLGSLSNPFDFILTCTIWE